MNMSTATDDTLITSPVIRSAEQRLAALDGWPGREVIVRPCLRCTKGRVTFTGYAGSVCFACGGSGSRETTVAKERARLRSQIRRERQMLDRAASRVESRIEQEDEVARLCRELYGYSGAVYPAPGVYGEDPAWTEWLDFCRGTLGVCPTTRPLLLMRHLAERTREAAA